MEGSGLTGAGNGKAGDSPSLVVEVEVDKMPEDCGGGGSEKLMETSESEASGIMEKGSFCSSWVMEMEKMREDAKPSVEMARWNRHSIYRVCHYIKQNTNSEAYSPQFVSLGPLHHGEPHLQPMEEHKRRALLHMANRSGKPIQEFIAAIDEVADELHAAYNDLDDDKWSGTNKGCFVEMMVMDGCFLLEWAGTAGIVIEGTVAVNDYATNDPIFSWGSHLTLWPIIRRDIIAMENQLPLLILQRLLAVSTGKFATAREVNNIVLGLLEVPCFDQGMDELGLHLLDIFHKSYCGTSPQSEEADKYKYEPCTPCAIELSEAGIQLRKNNTESIHGVDFENGVLSMPLFELHDETEATLLNLMVFEWLHPDANSFVRSYISFVDQMVVSDRDVALLRSEGIFSNLIGSDKKVVKMFNTLTKLAGTPNKGSKLGYVNWMINIHCKKRRNKWRAIFMNTYLSNPWVITSMVAASILVVATLLQTIYTVVPFYTKG